MHIEKLVELKKQESELKIAIAAAQELAIEEAIGFGKTGSIGTFDGAKVILKLLPIKVKTPLEIQELEYEATELENDLYLVNQSEILQLKDRIDYLCSCDRSKELRIIINAKMSEMPKELIPQISVTLPK